MAENTGLSVGDVAALNGGFGGCGGWEGLIYLAVIASMFGGGFGGGTEKAVNDLLRLWGYKQNGVIGEKFVDIVMK